MFQAAFNEASKDLKAHAKTLNTALTGREWLVGNSMSLADVAVAVSLVIPLQILLDGGLRKAMKEVNSWAERVFALPEFRKVYGQIHFCGKALKPNCIPDPKVEKKKEAPVAAAPKPAEKKPEKKIDNVESLPPTHFNVYDFKTFYVNHEDKKGAAVDEWYKMLDWEGWSFWHFHYEKYGDEGKLLHVTNNLLTGFMSRAEHTGKYTFARMGVFGEEPNLEIMGVWLVRGLEIPDGLAKEHAQFEYYKTRKLDPRNNKDDDTLVREYFGGVEEETIHGLKAQTLRWHK